MDSRRFGGGGSTSSDRQHPPSSHPNPSSYYFPNPSPAEESNNPSSLSGFTNTLTNSLNNLTSSIVNNPTISNLMSGVGSSVRPSFPSSSSNDGTGSRDSSCDTCATRLGFFYRKKKTCIDCQKDFCSTCFQSFDTHPDPRTRKYCRRCRIFNQWPLDRRSLTNLRVKDLRWYLERRHVNVTHCKEKSELVDLILRCNGINPTSSYTEASSPTPTGYRSQRRASSEADPFLENRPSVPPELSTNNSSNSSSSTESWEVLEPIEGQVNATNRSTSTNNTSSRRPSVVIIEDDESQGATGGSDINSSNHGDKKDDVTKPTLTCTASDFKAFNIEDIQTEEQLQELTARQLKLILTRNFVDYKGCCERDELMAKVLRLWKEKQDVKNQIEMDAIPDENLCKICMESVVDCVLLECGHMISCVKCGKRLAECPICRQYVVRAVRIFRS